MKLGLLGFSGDSGKSRTSNLGIYRPESNRHIQDFNGKARLYQHYGTSPQIVNQYNLMSLTGLTFSSNGTYVYVLSDSTNHAYQFTLNTPWDITTLNSGSRRDRELDSHMYTQTGNTHRLSQPSGITFSPDGYKMILVDSYYNKVYQFSLSNPWMIDTATFLYTTVNNDRPVWPLSDSQARDICFSNNGERMFVLSKASTSPYNMVVTYYDLNSGATAFDIGTLGSPNYTAVQSLIVENLDNYMRGLTFNDTGLKLYVCGLNNAKIHELNLTTPFLWDSSNPVYSDIADILYEGSLMGREGYPEAIFMNKTGNNMDLYVTGSQSSLGSSKYNLIYQYKLMQK